MTATASGSTIEIAATSDGSNTDYTLSTSYTFNSPFTSPAFTSSASGASLTGGSSAENGTGAYHFTLVHDPVGDVTNANDSVEGNQTFGYDALNRRRTAAAARAITRLTVTTHTATLSATIPIPRALARA